METLTAKEKAFLEKMERNKKKHNEAQRKYKETHLEKVKEYNKEYRQNIKEQKKEIIKKINNIEQIIEPEEQSLISKINIKMHERTKSKTEIEEEKEKGKGKSKTTIDDYLKKTNILNKLLKGRELSPIIKEELRKLLSASLTPEGNIQIIINEMDYLKDTTSTINKIKIKYPNENTFKTYINILAVISSNFKDLKDIKDIYSKIATETDKNIKEKREENTIEEYEKDKIILVGEEEFFKNINKLDKIDDILIYALYLLFPARRLDYRNMKLTTEEDINKLNKSNYLIIGDNMRFIFNDYKTSKAFKKQIFNIPINLKNVINKYINIKDLNDGDLLFKTDDNKIINEGNFSAKISNVFKKVYDVPICIRYLRMSWISNLYKTNPTGQEIKNLAYTMSHSTDEARRYNKIFKK
jgi:hypothetical protein